MTKNGHQRCGRQSVPPALQKGHLCDTDPF